MEVGKPRGVKALGNVRPAGPHRGEVRLKFSSMLVQYWQYCGNGLAQSFVFCFKA